MNWIAIKDEAPPEDQRFIVYGKTPNCSCYVNPTVFEANTWNCDKGKIVYGEYDCTVEATHWMPLPKLPSNEPIEGTIGYFQDELRVYYKGEWLKVLETSEELQKLKQPTKWKKLPETMNEYLQNKKKLKTSPKPVDKTEEESIQRFADLAWMDHLNKVKEQRLEMEGMNLKKLETSPKSTDRLKNFKELIKPPLPDTLRKFYSEVMKQRREVFINPEFLKREMMAKLEYLKATNDVSINLESLERDWFPKEQVIEEQAKDFWPDD